MVKVALLMNLSWIRGNYFKVLKMTSQLTALQACIFHQKLNHVRMLVHNIIEFEQHCFVMEFWICFTNNK